MATQEVKRKLAAILSADVKEYSRLMGEDEKGTVRILNTYKALMTGLIQEHHGRVVDAPGDNLLAEFASVVDAVECSVEIQKELKAQNAELPENRRMEFRIGVNLGDVIEEGERIYGDGVNIAARLESLSNAGGICISGTSYDQVENKLRLGYEYLGEQAVKNIAKPVRAYRVLMESEAAGKVIGEKKVRSKQSQRVVISLVAAVIVLVAAFVIWRLYLHPTPSIEVAFKEKMAYPLPDKPSIAVLPFVNMSEDPKQEFLSDGLTEEIITALSKIPKLFVIARNSSFVYKGKPVNVQQVSRELGVKYVLEGSVRRSGDQLRITSQLIDATTGNHLWAERYDRQFKDIFAIQDEIAMKILTALQVRLTEGEQAGFQAKSTKNLDAYLKYLQGREYVLAYKRDDLIKARKMGEEIISLDPNFYGGYTLLSLVELHDVWLGISKSPNDSLMRAIELATKSIAITDTPGPHTILASIYVLFRKHDEALTEARKAVEMDPNGGGAHMILGHVLYMSDRAEEAIPVLQKAIRLNPYPPANYYHNLAFAYLMLGKNEEAITAARKAVRIQPDNILAHLALVSSYSLLGREEEARAEVGEVLRIDPKYSVEEWEKRSPIKSRDFTRKYYDSLRKAGLPEKPSATIPPSAEVAPKEKIPPPKSEKVSKPVAPPPPKEEVASKEKMAFPLPDKPSIAVLPFVNMSGDPKKDYLSDGITEEIINALSKIPTVFVIARNSTFTYKGKPVRVQQVSEEMGVQYVMEGSVQWAGDRVRITVQLIDALKGHHLFSERYDRELKDIFALQDDITKKALMAMRVAFRGEDARASEKGTKNLDAYLKLLQAWEHIQVVNKDKVALARPLVEESLALDPENASAYAALANVNILEVWVGISKSPRESLDRAEELAKKAIALDDSLMYAHTILSLTYVFKKQFDKALSPAERAVALSPNSAWACFMLGSALLHLERFEEAIPHFKKSLRLSPIPIGQCLNNLAGSYRFLGRYDEAIATFKKLLQLQPDYLPAHAGLAATYVLTGRQEEAGAEAAEVMRIDPQFSLERYAKTLPYRQALVDQLVEAWRKAGLK